MADIFNFYVHDDRTIEFDLAEPIMLEDNNVTDWLFHIPKTLNGIDMSSWAWWLVYVNAAGNTYTRQLEIGDDSENPVDNNAGTYTVEYGMSIKAGTIKFSLEAINTDSGGTIQNEWHTKTYQTKVQDTLQGNQAQFAETESDVISALIVELQTRVRQLVGGAVPTPVSSTSAMTDTSTIYLNTTDGNWYYYNGSAWTAGGVYASGLTVDDEPTEDSTNLITSGAVYDLKEDLNEQFVDANAYIIADKGESRDWNGVTYTWDGTACTAVGTADGTSYDVLFNSQTSLPYPMVAGGTYRMQMDSTNIGLQIYIYGDTNRSLITSATDTEFTLPSDTVGAAIRLRIASGITVNETVHPKVLTIASTNAELDAMDEVLDAYIAKATNRSVDPYSNQKVVFTIDGTTINFSVWRVIANYKASNGEQEQIVSGTFTDTFSVPHGSFAIFDISTEEIQIKTLAEMKALDSNHFVLFCNSNGHVKGAWYKYWITQQVEELQATSDVVPSYYESQMVEKERAVNLLNAGLEGDSFVFITDHHYPSNSLDSSKLVKRICNRTGINKVFLGGDYINREDLKSDALVQINRVASFYNYPNVNTFRIVGNHEFNNPAASTDTTILANQLSESELRFSILNTFQSRVVYDPDTLSYYYDDTDKKIRIFVGAVNYKSSLNADSVKWVCDNLLLVPSGYSVLVIFHTILKLSEGTLVPTGTASDLLNVLDALKGHTSYTYGGNTYDFTNVNATLICALCGDVHTDGDYTTTGGVKVIATTTDSLLENGSLTRTAETNTEHAFDVVTVDTSNEVIYLTRIGAGSDRQFSY